jgi:hypothetical protein
MNEEVVRMKQREIWTPENLLCPMRRINKASELSWVRQSMQIKVEDAKEKNPDIDYTEAEAKVRLLIETEEYLRQLFEMAYQSRIAANRTEHRLMMLQMKYDGVIKENKELKQTIVL